jgi:3-oxoacyl-[acyl-carrier-protein] synthase III
MGSRIKAISVYLPDCVITNTELANDFGRWEPEKIESKLGIQAK